MNRICTWAAVLCTVAVVAIVLGVRWFGPHDLYEKDQPKTLAYTADVIRNGRFALPRDVIYQPATKPPMCNWVAAAVVKTTGVWTEWTLKSPSAIGVIATGAIVFGMARRRLPRGDAAALIVPLLAVGIWFTFGSNIRHGSVLRMSYLARPDMLLCAFLTGAWACFTLAVEKRTAREACRFAIGGWLCVTAAALTKGPAALMPIGFAFIYAAVARPEGVSVWRSYAKLWIPVGLPIVLICVGGWFALAARQDPTHVRQVIWGAEVAGRLMEKSPEGFQSKWYESIMWFVTKAQPWGAIAAGGLLASALVPRFRRTAGAAALYLLIVLIGLSLPAGKRMDYLLPAYAPAAVLISLFVADLTRHRVFGAAALFGLLCVALNEGIWGAIRLSDHSVGGHVDWLLLAVVLVVAGVALLIERSRTIPLACFAAVPLFLAISLGRQHLKRSLEAQNHWSDNAVRFVSAVRKEVHDGDDLLVMVRGKHPLTTLLGRHPGSYLTPKDLAAADYVIIPQQADLTAEILSKPLPMGFAQIEERPLSALGLYRHVPLERLIAIQKEIGTWTDVENPYHAPGTVFRDE
ncbi:MAG: glycosyl transferase [Phycisphaerales bacterium]|nr:glycosyl transferase [Phycisphaerales bacterium]